MSRCVRALTTSLFSHSVLYDYSFGARHSVTIRGARIPASSPFHRLRAATMNPESGCAKSEPLTAPASLFAVCSASSFGGRDSLCVRPLPCSHRHRSRLFPGDCRGLRQRHCSFALPVAVRDFRTRRLHNLGFMDGRATPSILMSLRNVPFDPAKLLPPSRIAMSSPPGSA